MKNGDVIREALIENTIHLIGEGGFEKATTKAIVSAGIDAPNVRLNEVYIYRLFGSKELLYAEAFSVLDNELFSTIQKYLAGFTQGDRSFRESLQHLFNEIWFFLTNNEDRCRCYVRYYYSAYFKESSLRDHRKLLADQEKFFRPVFTNESDVISLVHTTFMTMLDFAVRVYNGDLEDNEQNAYHIFNLLYNSLEGYLNKEILSDAI